MKQALWQLGSDFLSAIFFLVLYAVTGSLPLSIGVGIGVAIVQLARLKWLGRPIDAMQWMSLGLVIVFGGASLLTHSPRFVMAKPSVIHAAVGAVMLRRGWMGRYLPPVAQQNLPPAVITGAGYGWALLMFALAATNLVIATTCDFATWAWFISFGAIAAKVAAFALQYVVFRSIVRHRLVRASA